MTLELGSGRSHVRLEWRAVGDDLAVTITGGERPHVGATALAWPVGDGWDGNCLTAPGHREGEVALECAAALCQALDCTVQVTCGIHVDNATPEEIALLCAQVRELTAQALAVLGWV